MKSKTELRVGYFDKSFVKLASFYFLERFFSKKEFWNLQRFLEFLLNFIYFLYNFFLNILLAKRTLDGRGCVPVQLTSFSQRNISWPFANFCYISIMQLHIPFTCVYIYIYIYSTEDCCASSMKLWVPENVVLFIVLP